MRGRRRGRAGDAPLRPAVGRRSARCARRRRRTTTATSPSRTSCRSRPPRRCSSAPAPRCPSCRRRARSASSASSACPRRPPALLAFRGELGRLLRGRPAPTPADAATLANWVTQRAGAAPRGRRPRRSRRSSPRRSRSWWRWSTPRRSRSPPARRCWTCSLAEGGDPAAIVEEQGLGDAGRRRARGDRGARDRRRPRRRREDQGRQAEGVGAIVGAVMRETKGRADGGEVQRLIREKLGRLSA